MARRFFWERLLARPRCRGRVSSRATKSLWTRLETDRLALPFAPSTDEAAVFDFDRRADFLRPRGLWAAAAGNQHRSGSKQGSWGGSGFIAAVIARKRLLFPLHT